MPLINFNIAIKNNIVPKHRDSIIAKNVIGVVWVTEDAEYYVKLDDGRTYKIHKDCYSCKGKSDIYSQAYDNRILYIRCDNLCEQDNNYWLPFGVGCVVKGNIIEINKGIKFFYIKDCWLERNPNTGAAIDFLKEHLEEINRIIRERRKCK